MNAHPRFLRPSQAARRLGVSIKALRLYERHGLLSPGRTASGWRAYGAEDLRRAGEIVALRALGLGLGEIARIIEGDAGSLDEAMERQGARLTREIAQLVDKRQRVEAVREAIRAGLGAEGAERADPAGRPAVSFALPWPWDGEPFHLPAPKPITYITGPLFSGKTRFAQRLAEALAGAAFVGLDRAAHGRGAAPPEADAEGRGRAAHALALLSENGARRSDALVALVHALEQPGPTALVVDMIEEGLDEATQQALIAHLRRRGPGARPIFALTRSTAILDLAAVTAAETVILCPANHSPPMLVAPHPGSEGYEAVATCLASPATRSRTAGVVARFGGAATPPDAIAAR